MVTIGGKVRVASILFDKKLPVGGGRRITTGHMVACTRFTLMSIGNLDCLFFVLPSFAVQE